MQSHLTSLHFPHLIPFRTYIRIDRPRKNARLLLCFLPLMSHLMKCEYVRSRFEWYVKTIYCMNIKLVFSHFSLPSFQFWWDNKKPHVPFVKCASYSICVYLFSPINWCWILWKIFKTIGVAQYDSLTIKVLNTINIHVFPYFSKLNDWCLKPTQKISYASKIHSYSSREIINFDLIMSCLHKKRARWSKIREKS